MARTTKYELRSITTMEYKVGTLNTYPNVFWYSVFINNALETPVVLS